MALGFLEYALMVIMFIYVEMFLICTSIVLLCVLRCTEYIAPLVLESWSRMY